MCVIHVYTVMNINQEMLLFYYGIGRGSGLIVSAFDSGSSDMD